MKLHNPKPLADFTVREIVEMMKWQVTRQGPDTATANIPGLPYDDDADLDVELVIRLQDLDPMRNATIWWRRYDAASVAGVLDIPHVRKFMRKLMCEDIRQGLDSLSEWRKVEELMAHEDRTEIDVDRIWGWAQSAVAKSRDEEEGLLSGYLEARGEQ